MFDDVIRFAAGQGYSLEIAPSGDQFEYMFHKTGEDFPFYSDITESRHLKAEVQTAILAVKAKI